MKLEMKNAPCPRSAPQFGESPNHPGAGGGRGGGRLRAGGMRGGAGRAARDVSQPQRDRPAAAAAAYVGAAVAVFLAGSPGAPRQAAGAALALLGSLLRAAAGGFAWVLGAVSGAALLGVLLLALPLLFLEVRALWSHGRDINGCLERLERRLSGLERASERKALEERGALELPAAGSEDLLSDASGSGGLVSSGETSETLGKRVSSSESSPLERVIQLQADLGRLELGVAPPAGASAHLSAPRGKSLPQESHNICAESETTATGAAAAAGQAGQRALESGGGGGGGRSSPHPRK